MAEEVFKKETGWGGKSIDFVGESEIVVTITLHEYRSLVESNAKHAEELRKASEKASEEAAKARALREKLDKLLESDGDKADESDFPF